MMSRNTFMIAAAIIAAAIVLAISPSAFAAAAGFASLIVPVVLLYLGYRTVRYRCPRCGLWNGMRPTMPPRLRPVGKTEHGNVHQAMHECRRCGNEKWMLQF